MGRGSLLGLPRAPVTDMQPPAATVVTA